jgi:hypothetical protein
MGIFTNLGKDKKNIFIWSSVLLASILLIIAVSYILINNLINYNPKKLEKQNIATTNQKSKISLQQISLIKSFIGTRETIDGNIEPVLLQINEMDTSNLSFQFTLNIGMSKKYNGYGIIDTNKMKLVADVLGDLELKIDSNSRICLISNTSQNFKFNLIEEVK